MNYVARKFSEKRTFYHFTEKNEKGECIEVEITECYPDNHNRNSLPRLWKKSGHKNYIMESYLSVMVYVTGKDSETFEAYNPTIDSGIYPLRLNFDWVLEVTRQNKEKLLNEIYKKFMSGKE